MSELERLELELAETETEVFDHGRDELRPRMEEVIDRIAELSVGDDRFEARMVEVLREGSRKIAVAKAAMTWEERQTYERALTARQDRMVARGRRLRHEWEQWRYQRSKLPPEKRGRMMREGQRQCRWCDGFFEPSTLRQRYCTDTCRKLAHKAKAKARAKGTP